LLPIFGFPQKKKYKKNISKKIFRRNLKTKEREKDDGLLKKGQNWFWRFKNAKG